METLRNVSSTERSKESSEAVRGASETSSNPERNSGGGPDVEENEGRINSYAGPSPPRAPVTDDTEDEVEEVEETEDDDNDNSAVEKTSSLVGSAASRPVGSYSDALTSKNLTDKMEEGDSSNKVKDDEARENGDDRRGAPTNSAEEESSVRNSDEETSQVSIRTMPVAKVTTEDEEQDDDDDDEDAEKTDEEEVDDEKYEEADDQASVEGLYGNSSALRRDNEGSLPRSMPRIIARESGDDISEEPSEDEYNDVSEEEYNEEAVEEAVEPEEKEQGTLEAEEKEQFESPVAEKESTVKELNATPVVVPRADADVGDVLKTENSNAEESPMNADASSREEDVVVEKVEKELSQAVKTEDSQVVGSVQPQEEDTELTQAVSSLAAQSESTDKGVKQEVAPEVVPLVTSEIKQGELEEIEQATTLSKTDVEARGCSSDLAEELQKLSASLSNDVSKSDEAERAAIIENAPAERTIDDKEESVVNSGTITESGYVVKRAASNDLMAELEKLAAARLEKESSNDIVNPVREASEEDVKDVLGETTVVTTSTSEGAGESLSKKEDEPALPESNVPKELAVDSSERNSLEVQSVITTDPEKVSSTPTPSNAEKESPEATEVQAVEEGKLEKADSSVVREELSKEILEDSEVVPSPAKMYTALKAVDDDMPVLKSENGNVAEDQNVESESRVPLAVDFAGKDGDTDANAAEEDNENGVDEDEDEDEDDADMDTAKALAELAMTAGKSGDVLESGKKSSMGAAGPSLPSLPQRPAVRKAVAATASDSPGRITQRPNGAPSTQITSTTDESANSDAAEGDETREKLQNIRVKFLRLAHRLGQSPQNVVVAQVLYRLGLAESLRGGSAPNRSGAFSFDRANALAEEQEAANQEEELDFACTILVLGKTGVGKSSTINSIFDDRKSVTSAFKPSTNKVQEVIGTVHGIKVRVIDTPGLLPSVADQQHNERIMGQVKKYIKKASPDIVLYFDRLDMQSRDFGDLPLLRTITDLFGAAVWFNAIVVLTHASSAPPDGPNGVPLSYEMFVAQRSHVVQQTIRQAAGDMRLMNPVSLVENHPACRTNRTGQRVLPNGQIWKPQLLLLCFASKILAEANSLLKLQETAAPGRPFGQRSRVPPLPFLLSSLLQSRAQLKLPDEQAGESDESDDDEEEEDSDADDYDELPPFRPLSKEELEDLTKEQREDYMEELADRERMFQKKQYREEIRRRKEAKKRQAQMSKEELAEAEEAEDEAGKAAAVPVPMPDMALPPSFDSDYPTHRYRYLETANQWLVRPVLETHGWDHDAGYDGFNVEKMFVVKDKIPASVSGQVTKDKKEAQVNFEAAASLRHGEGKVTLTGFDVQTIGKDLAYTLRAETRFNNFKRNKTTAGVTATYLNDTIAAGVKLEDRVLIGKRVKLVVNGGVLTGKGDKAYGGSLEATLRGKEYPLSRTLSTLGLSVMNWHGDLAIGGNLQSQFMVGKTMMVGRANLNNRGSGQVSIRASSSEQLQMVLIGIVPILRSLINCRFGFGGQSQQ